MITQLHGAGYPILPIEFLQCFVNHLSDTTSYMTICDSIHHLISNNDHALLPTFKKLASEVTLTHFNYICLHPTTAFNSLHLTVPPSQFVITALSTSYAARPTCTNPTHCRHWPIKVLNIRRIYWE